MTSPLARCLVMLALTPCVTHAAPILEGFAMMPANTFSDGPTSGQFAGAGAFGNALPLVSQQPVQGFSAVLNGPVAGTFRVMTDNGFGTQGNSADTLLRMYAVRPDFRTAAGGTGTVGPVDYLSGASLPTFSAASRITLSDPDQKLGFPITASQTHYYNNPANPLVDASIRDGRLLTGADLDIESVRQDKHGHLWFGDEFGPFLVKTDATGRVLRRDVPLPGVLAPQNPYLGTGTPNLGGSGGFEGMAINPQGDRLYTLLEKSVTGDAAGSLRINEFHIDTESYTDQQWLYRLDSSGTAIGDMVAINEHEFIVIERNGATATSGTPFKKLFKINLNEVDQQGFVSKTELVDLMNIADPYDLNGDGQTVFTFPWVTIEDVLILDERTLLVINDNNYPGGGGRGAFSDTTEFLRIRLDAPLNVSPVPEPSAVAMVLGGLGVAGVVARRRRHLSAPV